MAACGRDREVAMEPGSSHSGCDLALAYGDYLCSRQTGATGQERTLSLVYQKRSFVALGSVAPGLNV